MIMSYFREPLHDNRFMALLPLTGDKKAKRNAIFVMILKKLLLTDKFHLQKKLFCTFVI